MRGLYYITSVQFLATKRTVLKWDISTVKAGFPMFRHSEILDYLHFMKCLPERSVSRTLIKQ